MLMITQVLEDLLIGADLYTEVESVHILSNSGKRTQISKLQISGVIRLKTSCERTLKTKPNKANLTLQAISRMESANRTKRKGNKAASC